MTSILNMGSNVFRDESGFAFALAALEGRDFSGAEEALSALIERIEEAPERAFLLNKRGVARIGLDRRELARDDFAAALEARPDYAPALTNLGNLLLEEGAVEAAIARYERAVARDPEYAIAYLNLSVAYKRAGRIADAVRALRHSQRLESRASASGASFWRRLRRR
jgi:protein O-GlcNAc transferase